MFDLKDIIDNNRTVLKELLQKNLNIWDKGRPTLAPLHCEKYVVCHFNVDNFDILVITGKEILEDEIINGFVIGHKKEDTDEWKLFVDTQKEWGCNTYDYDSLIVSYYL